MLCSLSKSMTMLLFVSVFFTQPASMATARLKADQLDDTGTLKNRGLVVSMDEHRTCRMRFVEDKHLTSIHPHMHAPSSLTGESALEGGGSGVSIAEGRDDYFGDVVLKHGGHKDSIELLALAAVEHELEQRSLHSGVASNLTNYLPRFKYIYMAPAHFRRNRWSEAVISVCDAACQSSRGQRLDKVSVELSNAGVPRRLEIFVPIEDEATELLDQRCSELGEGYAALQQLFASLVPLQEAHDWKFTLAQKKIGGSSPVTASKLLTTGKLTGSTLIAFTDQFIDTVHTLKRLSAFDVQCHEDSVREEFAQMSQRSPVSISQRADKYVGHAIRKNFYPVTGRFTKMRDFAAMFSAWSAGSLFFDYAESEPTYLLSFLLKQGAHLETVFADGLVGQTALDKYSDSWWEVLERAVNLASLSDCIWNCGFSDAGLHNLFFSGELGAGSRRLWFFDLGMPEALPLPGFLTKFLMSFFHALGMEDSDEGWVNRFVPRGALYDGRSQSGEISINISESTQSLLHDARGAFKFVLRRLIDEFFMGQWSVCNLLIDYVVLQLLSDAGFCLEKWWTKGGGQRKDRPQDLHTWLWRSIWDMYVASDVAHRSWCS